MPSYRLEEAPSSRAGCQNKECKDAKIKIQKGELRLGSWVDTDRFQGWFWRHWGCVTPKVVSNMNEVVEEESGGGEKDFTLLDGYEELSAEMQEKVRQAVSQGHVADEDWRGDVEMNRPGKSGFRKRALKKQMKGAESEDEESAPEETPKPAKTRGGQDGSTQIMKKATRGKKTSAKPEPEQELVEEEEKKKSQKRGDRSRNSTANALANAEDEPEAKKNSAATKKRNAPSDNGGADAEPEEKKTSKRSRKAKTAAVDKEEAAIPEKPNTCGRTRSSANA